MTLIQFYLSLAVLLIVVGMVRMFLVRDRVARLVAMNVMGAGTLLFLIALAARTQPVDPVLTALVITGLVITVAFSAVGALLISRIEEEKQ
ncbi:MAG: NADH-quinone oxidoreductase subunit K [Corynebacterium sp.]|uniref:NADH-quinone oxidoreductase subunit K n=1 Tax=Corynebacterium sp. TaxID=1720 RepID=UPI0026DFF638|nr:NADH-quinone oxidoreductase subunit K [Corynebacterium sp.]MDO5669255.1 NADH-quinone oxidoreductase subunit K [Corynebacterium sp.]